MASSMVKMGMAFVLVTTLWAGAMAQSGCNSVLIGMAPCLNYVTGSSTTPSSSCCSSLASVVKSQPQCLCSALNGDGAALGISINETLALALPAACKVQTPPVSRCTDSGNAPAPSPVPVGSPESSQADSPTSSMSGTTPPFFGNTYACDYQLTVGQDINSESLGNGQGFFLESSRADFSALLSINLVLKGPYFSGSTLTLIGQDRFDDEYRELSIVGGTGDFRLATGTASMFNVYRVKDVAIVRLTLFVRHYGMASASA